MNHDLKVKKILASVRDCKVKWVMLKDSNSKVTSIAAEELHAGLPFMAIKLYRHEVGSSYVVFCIHIANDGKISVISSYDLKNPNLLHCPKQYLQVNHKFLTTLHQLFLQPLGC